MAWVNVGRAQGAWTPPNADLSYPRTLVRAAEVPAVIAWIGAQPDMHGYYSGLYADAVGINPGGFSSNAQRRVAAHTAKNCAFAYLLQRKPLQPAGLDTLTAAESSFFRDKAIYLLDNINTAVETYPDFGNYIWRSNELIDNLIAYDLLKGAGVPDSLLATGRQRLEEYATNLHTQVAFNTFGIGLTSLHVDNHTLRSCGAIGMAAVVLSDAQSSDQDGQPTRWMQTALYHIDNVLWRSNVRQSEPGQVAGYSEGPHYLRFGMRQCLEFFHAMGNFLPDTTLSVTFEGNTRSVRHPFHDPNYDNLWEWVMRIRLPDGRDPQLEDCFAQTHNSDMTFMEKPEYRPTYHGSRFNPAAPTTLWDQLHHSSDDVAADYIAAMTPSAPVAYPLLQALPASGDLVMRSGWDTTSTYFHISAKNGRARTSANGHNHVDVTSFILHARGQELALDPGYLQWERRDEVDGPTHHNMVLVDGQGPGEASTGNAGDVDGFIENWFSLSAIDYAEARATYLGTTVRRKPLFVRKDYILLADELSAAAPHAYQWQLHAMGLEGGDSTHGSFALDSTGQRAVWTKNGVRLQAVVTARGGLSGLDRDVAVHELRYDSIETHTRLLATRGGSANTAFLAVLVPYENDSPDVSLRCTPACDAIRVERGGHIDLAWVGTGMPAAASGLPQDLASTAQASFYSQTTSGDFSCWMLQGGEQLQLGNDTLAQASVASNWALGVLDSATYEGHAGAAGTLTLDALAFVPQSVLGWAVVQAWSYDPASGKLEIVFSGPGRFTIHEDYIVSAGRGVEPPVVAVFPNPAADEAVLEVRGGSGSGHWQVHGMDGRLVAAGRQSGPQQGLRLGHLPRGVYVVSVHDDALGFLGQAKLVLQ